MDFYVVSGVTQPGEKVKKRETKKLELGGEQRVRLLMRSGVD